MLVVVENGDLHPRLELLLDVEALGRLDVLEVDAAERGLEPGDALDELVGVLFVDLDVEHVDVGEPLEEDALPFHDGLAGERTDVAQPEHGRAVRDDGDEIPLSRVLVDELGVPRDLEARARRRRACRRERGRGPSRRAWGMTSSFPLRPVEW